MLITHHKVPPTWIWISSFLIFCWILAACSSYASCASAFCQGLWRLIQTYKFHFKTEEGKYSQRCWPPCRSWPSAAWTPSSCPRSWCPCCTWRPWPPSRTRPRGFRRHGWPEVWGKQNFIRRPLKSPCNLMANLTLRLLKDPLHWVRTFCCLKVKRSDKVNNLDGFRRKERL